MYSYLQHIKKACHFPPCNTKDMKTERGQSHSAQASGLGFLLGGQEI